MEAITTVKALVKELSHCLNNEKHVLDVMDHVKIPREEFERYYSWSDEEYTRNVLARNEDFEVLLICWEKGQSSPIHDFNPNYALEHNLPVTENVISRRKRSFVGSDDSYSRV